jgi:hypothetical protein
VKTLGQLKYHEGSWYMLLKPHVAVRAKRIFPRAAQDRAGIIRLADSAEVARDIEWMLERWPLEVSDDHRHRLKLRADESRAVEEAVESILSGRTIPLGDDWTEPARPGRDYQTLAADMVWRTGRLLLGDEIGLGKTQTAAMLFRDPNTLPAVIIAPTHLPPQWQRELEIVMPHLRTHIVKTTAPYPVDTDVLVTSYSKLRGWRDHLAGMVKSIVFDEVQELRHPGTDKYNAAAHVAASAQWRLGLSATPVYNYGGEAHSIYDVLAPGELGERSEFFREWGTKTANNGQIIVEKPKALGEHLRDSGLLLARTRKDVGRELPAPIPIVQEIDADERALDAVADEVAEMAKLIITRSGSKEERFKASGDLDWKLRQATGIAKAPYVAAFTEMLLQDQDAVVLFGWHRAVYELWKARLRHFNPLMYTGSESSKQKDENAQRFINGDSRVLIVSLRSGAGLDGLQKRTNTCVFGELDWSPAMHEQCTGRLARDGQLAAVSAYYLVSESGSDPVIQSVLNLKRQQSEPMMKPDAALFAPAVVDTSDRMRQLAQSFLDRHQSAKGAAA